MPDSIVETGSCEWLCVDLCAFIDVEMNLCVCECCLPYPALPLTIDNVYEVVKTVRISWRKLARELLG